MDKSAKKYISKRLAVQAVILFAAALLMTASVFLPYLSATKEYAQYIDETYGYLNDLSDYLKEYSDEMPYYTGNMDIVKLKSVSIFDYSRIFYSLHSEIGGAASLGLLYVVPAALIAALPVIAALLALGRKPVGAIVFDVLAIGVFQMWRSGSAITDSDLYNWGIAYYMFPIAAAAAFAVGIWMLVRKSQLKKQMKAQISAQAAQNSTQSLL